PGAWEVGYQSPTAVAPSLPSPVGQQFLDRFLQCRTAQAGGADDALLVDQDRVAKRWCAETEVKRAAVVQFVADLRPGEPLLSRDPARLLEVEADAIAQHRQPLPVIPSIESHHRRQVGVRSAVLMHVWC